MAITLKDLADRYRVNDGKHFQLKHFDPADTWKLKKDSAQAMLTQTVDRLAEMQAKLYAQDNWALLLIFQAMDAAGKDGTIQHVFTGVNPQGCEVWSFKTPSNEELDHDFLWRCSKRVPSRGRIGIFNRSYYEETLVVRVHRELLAKEKIPHRLMTGSLWKERFEDIAGFERYLARNGVVVRKFFLHLSKAEQKQRFLKRLNKPDKNWKFSAADLNEREHWDDYMEAYEDMIRHTATEEAPWYVVPADHKWFSRLAVASVIIETLESLKLEFPKIDAARKKDLAEARTRLQKNGKARTGDKDS